MYVAVKGGEKAIRAAHALQEQKRRGDGRLPELSVDQIGEQLNLAVDRVMTEGGIADRELAALALKQASGDNVEAIFLLRAYRTTLPRLAVSEPIDTAERLLARPTACADDAVLAHRLKPASHRRLRLNHCCIEEKVTKTLKVYRAPPLTSPSGYGIVTAINNRQICCTEQVPSAPVLNCRRGLKKANPSKDGDAKSPVYKASAS